jgi:hypothetical protein
MARCQKMSREPGVDAGGAGLRKERRFLVSTKKAAGVSAGRRIAVGTV